MDAGTPEGYFYAEVEFPTEEEALAWDPGGWRRWLLREVTREGQESMAAYWERTQRVRSAPASRGYPKFPPGRQYLGINRIN